MDADGSSGIGLRCFKTINHNFCLMIAGYIYSAGNLQFN